MKELKSLERMLAAFEAVHLALCTCCLSLPLLFFVPEFDDVVQLLWALGAALPVLAVHALCRRLPTKPRRLLAGLLVLAITLLLCRTTLLRVIYALLVLLQLFICTVLPWPDGKPVLTEPKFYHAPAFLLLYAFSMVQQNAVMQQAALVIALLFTLNFLLHLNTRRLRSALCDQTDAAVSDRRILRTNRKAILAFAVVGSVLIVALPLLLGTLRSQPARLPQPAEDSYTARESEPQETLVPEDARYVEPGREISVKPLTDTLLVVLAVFLLSGTVLTVISIILWLRTIRKDQKTHAAPKEQDGFEAVPLPPQADTGRGAKALPRQERSWSRRIRRQFERLIRSKTDRSRPLAALSPQELEDAAALAPGAARTQLHALYAKARYGAEACTRQEYQAAKAAAALLRKGDTNP